MSNKQRRSQWRIVNRCLNILLRLMHGAATGQELREIIQNEALQDEHEIGSDALQRRFEEDRLRLRE